MELLEKFIILTLLFTLTSAKSYYYEFHYPHRHRNNFQWNVRHPQPPFSFEAGWPMGPFGIFPYPQTPNEEFYPDPNSYQQEILVQSLNKALTKLNMLLPPISNSNQQETTSFPPNTTPEVLAEALNKAIDRLGVLLASQQMSVNKETMTEAQTEQVMSVNTETITEGQKEQMMTVTEGQKEPMIVTIEPNKIYENANSAIDDLNKLFSNLPDELKPRPNQNNNNVIKPIIMNPQPVEPPFVSAIVSKTTAGPLFTSDVFENKNPAPSVPNIVSNSGVSTENNLFTSSELENNVINSSTAPSDVETSTEQVSESNTDVTTENLEIPIDGVTIDNDITTSPFPDIDIRWGEKNGTKKAEIRQDIVFPDDDDDDNPFIDLSSRFKENQTSTTKNPQTFKPQTISNLQSQQPAQNRPFVSNVVELADRFQTTTTTQNPQLILTYKPSRPPIHADVFPPNPTVKPQTNLEFGTSEQSNQNRPVGTNVVDLVDRNQQTTTTTQNPQLILTYKPSRPPIHADIFPPNPTPKPDSNLQSQTNVNPPNSNDFVDRFSPTTENIASTTKNNKPYYPTPYYSSPINLEYKPTRPFYAPNPIIYPSPGKIPPGTPWPASSTERMN